MRHLPLQGTRVVEVGQIVAGPAAGLILADMGADVIKVEPPDAATSAGPGTCAPAPSSSSIATSAASSWTSPRSTGERSPGD